MNADALTSDRIGQDWLRGAVAPVSDFGRRAEDAARAYGPGDRDAARMRCEQIVELAGRMDPEGVVLVRAALRRAPDPADIVSRATAGDPLADVDFFELGRFADALDATARAWDAAGGPAAGRPPAVRQIGEQLAPGRDGGTFYLSGEFAAALGAARQAYETADAELCAERERLRRALLPLVGRSPEDDEFIAMRDELPDVPAGVRVVRETPAYRLLAIELDEAARAATARRDDALETLARAEEQVRRQLAARVARHGEALLTAADALGELDRTLARVAFTQRWGGCVPQLSDPAQARFAFTGASFVPLRSALAEAGLPYTPISLDLPGAAVLTGPNMGGKSAALATCGFLCACVASGVPPPAERAELPLLGSVAWIGGEPPADRARLLSAFGSEVVRTRDVLAHAVEPALVLVDEFARTTGPREGRALLVALVEALAARGTFALAATHFEGVAADAGVRHFTIAGLGARALDAHAARDIHAALDAVARAMDYRIVEVQGRARSRSDALALAGLLGLDAGIVERAAAWYDGSAAGPVERVTE